MFDVQTIRKDFPILQTEVYGHPLVYLDNAATTQVPDRVLNRIVEHYHSRNGNVHRGTHYLANSSTEQLETARARVAAFINAPSENCIVFTRGTTEALSTVAGGFRKHIGKGDVVVATELEHHSNYVPWQQLAHENGARFETVGITERGELDLGHLGRILELRPKIVALTCCSNVLGTITPVKAVAKMAHDAGALVVLDGAQIMRHRAIDVQDIGCDFFAFSGHKMMAGTGIGVLYGTQQALDLLEPCEFGGEMVDRVTKGKTSFADLPLRLEAGTPHYVGAIALGEAMDYLDDIGRENVMRYEDELVAHAVKSLAVLDGVTVLGSPSQRAGCISFVADGVHPFDLCAFADKMGVALRSGNNCAQPLLRALGTSSVARLSPAFYNTLEEIDYAVGCISRCLEILRAARKRS